MSMQREQQQYIVECLDCEQEWKRLAQSTIEAQELAESHTASSETHSHRLIIIGPSLLVRRLGD